VVDWSSQLCRIRNLSDARSVRPGRIFLEALGAVFHSGYKLNPVP